MKLAGQLLLGIGLMACSWAASAEGSAAPFNPPAESAIPAGPLGDSIRKGQDLIANTRARLPQNVGNGLNCTNCHLGNGRVQYASPFVGLWGVFPEYRSRNGKVASL